MHDPHAHRRIDELAERLDRLSALENLEAVPPLRLEQIGGVGTVLSVEEPAEVVEDFPVEAFDRVVELVDGILNEEDFYDATIEDRTLGAFVDATPIWVIDLAGSASLTAGMYDALVVRDEFEQAVSEEGGPFYLAIDNSTGAALTDATKWLKIVGAITPPAWSAVTAYVTGNLVTSGTDIYVCETGNTNDVPPSANWIILPSGLTDTGGYDGSGAFVTGNYVQEVRPVFAIRSATGGGGTGNILSINDDTTAAQTIGLGSTGTDVNIETFGVVYSAGVVYSRGHVVTSGGATYRYINATPSAGNAPPNASYWVSVTGDGLNVINVPDASLTTRGMINNGSQYIGEFDATLGMNVKKWSDGQVFLFENTSGFVGDVTSIVRGSIYVAYNSPLDIANYSSAGTTFSATLSSTLGYISSIDTGSGHPAGVFNISLAWFATEMHPVVGGRPQITPIFDFYCGNPVVQNGLGPNDYLRPCLQISYFTPGPFLNTKTGVWGTSGGGDTVSGGLITALGAAAFVVSISGGTTGLTFSGGATPSMSGTLATANGGTGNTTGSIDGGTW